MGLFSEMRAEQKILEDLKDAKKVLIISCPGCACESLSYTEGLPCRSLEETKDMEKNAYAIYAMKSKWEEQLKQIGKTVSSISVVFPCEMFDTQRAQIYEAVKEHDAVAVLSCSSGMVAIHDMFPEKDFKLVPMMKTSGSFVFRLIKDDSGKFSKVDKKTARIHKI